NSLPLEPLCKIIYYPDYVNYFIYKVKLFSVLFVLVFNINPPLSNDILIKDKIIVSIYLVQRKYTHISILDTKTIQSVYYGKNNKKG
ncbi:MAG TPA: hypothetical protein VF220_03350, partial [Nitrososphaeraceae archaeon]